jgi:hypothetical protein
MSEANGITVCNGEGRSDSPAESEGVKKLSPITPAQETYLIRVGYNPMAVGLMSSYEAHKAITQYRKTTPATMKQIALMARLGIDVDRAKRCSLASAERWLTKHVGPLSPF